LGLDEAGGMGGEDGEAVDVEAMLAGLTGESGAQPRTE
jgi:hypothetical protein